MNAEPLRPPVRRPTGPEFLDEDDFVAHVEQVLAEARRQAAQEVATAETQDEGTTRH